jgi:hypothetical protein
MKLPLDTIISEGKLREYLLTRRNEDDKSGFLALAGYGPTFWRQLETDIRQLIHDQDAELLRKHLTETCTKSRDVWSDQTGGL